ncbi:MAG: DUF3109 family protein [Luteibaculaceae bacterium]
MEAVEIDNILVDTRLFQTKFVCNLTACKGACCVQGTSGAPLTDAEADLMDDVYQEVKPFLRKEGIEAIEQQGAFEMEWDRELVTPLVEGKECAYTVFDKDGTAKCGIEIAYRAGATKFKKPISCALYPIRESKVGGKVSLHFSHWDICDPAHVCGADLNVIVYKFLKGPIISRFGEAFYEKMDITYQQLFSKER